MPRNQEITNVEQEEEDVVKRELFCTIGRTIKFAVTMENNMEDSQKSKNRTSIWSIRDGERQGAWHAAVHGVAKSRTQLSD